MKTSRIFYKGKGNAVLVKEDSSFNIISVFFFYQVNFSISVPIWHDAVVFLPVAMGGQKFMYVM